MKSLIIILLLTVGAGPMWPVTGQHAFPQPAPNKVFSHADTMQALHKLFRRSRSWGIGFTALAPVAAGVAAYSYPRMDLGIGLWGSDHASSNGYATAWLLGTPAAITLAVVGPISWASNSKRTEQEALVAYERHQPVSRRLQRRLHSRLSQTLSLAGTASR